MTKDKKAKKRKDDQHVAKKKGKPIKKIELAKISIEDIERLVAKIKEV